MSQATSEFFSCEVEPARGVARFGTVVVKLKKRFGPEHVVDLATQIAVLESSAQVALERAGLPATVVPSLAVALEVSRKRLLQMIGAPRASVESQISKREALRGDANRRTLNLLRLLAQAHDIVADSTASEAADFDVAAWLGRWIQTPQPALGGRPPAEFLDTEAGARLVERTLGAMRSGAYL